VAIHDFIDDSELNQIVFFLTYCLSTVLFIVAGIVLVKTAPSLANYINKDTQDSTSGIAVSDNDLHSLILSIAGIIISLLAFPELWITSANLIYFYANLELFDEPGLTRKQWIGMIAPVIQLGLGIWLFYGSRALSRYWFKLRTLGLDHDPLDKREIKKP
jgi:hypothetical protein